MKRRNFIELTGGSMAAMMLPLDLKTENREMTETRRKIVAYGAGYNPPFVKYVAERTGKPKPRICYLPTASADGEAGIIRWYEVCASLEVYPFVQKMFINSYDQKESFEDVLLSMDAIIVGGGNTLNMMAIWKAQGIDVILKKAWDKGIVLAGGSAGSLCWFEEGTTDSRPKELSKVSCLGFIKASHSPHYDAEPERRPRFQGYIKSKEFKAGYACDNKAAIYFEDNTVKEVVAVNQESNAYYVYEKNGEVIEEKLPKRVL
ncbi:MAG TPA: peptidase E [Chryseolinea sp.]|nr:peptidase E [Chryseolinea sp.]